MEVSRRRGEGWVWEENAREGGVGRQTMHTHKQTYQSRRIVAAAAAGGGGGGPSRHDLRALTSSRPSFLCSLSPPPFHPSPPSHIGWSSWSALMSTLAGGGQCAGQTQGGMPLLHLQRKGREGIGGTDALLPWCCAPLRRHRAGAGGGEAAPRTPCLGAGPPLKVV